MKIDRVTLENFGIYAHKSFQFDAAPLVLIFGPNESGKTTALHGLRQAMFGFRARTPYLIRRPMSAAVTGRLANGNELEFKRRKGRQDEVSGSLAGRAITPEEVSRLLCHIDIGSYEQLFGFSLDELREGEASLKNARLSDALAGGGLGGMQALQHLRTELHNSLGELYKSRGSNSRINVTLTDIQRSQEALRAHEVLPTAVDELQRTLADTRQRGTAVREQYGEIHGRQLTTERVLKTLPKYLELQALRRQLATLQVPEGIDSTFVARWSDYAQQRQVLAGRLETTREQLRRDELLISQLIGSHQASTFEQEIEQLGHQASEIQGVRGRLDELRLHCQDANSACQRILETLDVERVDDKLRQFTISQRQRRELSQASEQFVELNRQRIAMQAKLEEARDTLHALEGTREAASFTPDNMPLLQTLIKRVEALEEELKSKGRELQHALEDRELVRSQAALQRILLKGTQPSADWSPPTPAQVVQFQTSFAEIAGDRSENQRATELMSQQALSLQQQLSELDQRGTAELLSTQHVVRSARNTILQQWLDELEQPLLAASISPADQRERLEELQRLAVTADQVQDDLFATAEALAAFSQIEQQSARVAGELDKLKLQLKKIESRENRVARDWLQLWKSLPFAPPAVDRGNSQSTAADQSEAETSRTQEMDATFWSPSVMLDWLHAFANWKEKVELADRLRRETHLARSAMRHCRTQLLDEWPVSLREDTSCEALLAQFRLWETAERDALRDQQRLQSAVANLDKLADQLEQVQHKQQELRQRYEAWLSQVPIAAPWPLENVSKLFEALDQLRREYDICEKGLQQIAVSERQLAEYDRRMAQLSTSLGEPIDPFRPEVAAARWLDELQQMREHKTQRIKLNAAIAHHQSRADEMSQRLQELDGKLAKLCATVGTMDIAGVASLVDRVRRGEEMRIKISELSAAVEPLAAGMPLPEFFKLLESSSESSLRVELQELSRELHQLDEARKEADQQVGSLCQRMEQLANNQVAQQHQQQLQNLRGQLAEQAEEWVVQRMAQQLLMKSIERFAADHEPALLCYTRKYLSKLTGGRYTTVDHDNAHPGRFTIRNAEQQSFTPEQLSTGTREQLYLAIRMAFITHHAEHHEPLPVIMDDCFVNFDDVRVRYALEAIADWEAGLQTILLSCHGRVVQTLAEIAPETPAIHLERDTLTSVGELAAIQAATA